MNPGVLDRLTKLIGPAPPRPATAEQLDGYFKAAQLATEMLSNFKVDLKFHCGKPKWWAKEDIMKQPFFGKIPEHLKPPETIKFRRPVPYIAMENSSTIKFSGDKAMAEVFRGADEAIDKACGVKKKTDWGEMPVDWEDQVRRFDGSERKLRQLMLGEFLPDQRAIDLHDRLQQYYDDTPDDCTASHVHICWAMFNRWCRENGYTHDEVIRAKKEKFT